MNNSSDPQSFAELGDLGKNAWWVYLLGALLITGCFYDGALFGHYLIVSATKQKFFTSESGSGLDPVAVFVLGKIGVFLVLAGLWFVLRFFHRRPFISVITAHKQFKWNNFLFGFFAWALVESLRESTRWIAFPTTIQMTFSMPDFLRFLPAVFFITPFQTLAEELVFRGYVLQAFRSVRNIWVAATINGALFLLPHIWSYHLPLFHVMDLFYFSVGFIMTLVTIRSRGIELAFGAHLANNMFCAIVLSFPEYTTIASSTIFTCSEVNPIFTVISYVVAGTIFYLLSQRFLQAANSIQQINADEKMQVK